MTLPAKLHLQVFLDFWYIVCQQLYQNKLKERAMNPKVCPVSVLFVKDKADVIVSQNFDKLCSYWRRKSFKLAHKYVGN